MTGFAHVARLCVFILSTGFVLPAQWDVKSTKVTAQSRDRHVSLSLDIPVLAGGPSVKIRKVLNSKLRQAGGFNALISEAGQQINTHEKLSSNPSSRREDDEDFPWDYSSEFKVGLNTKVVTSLCLQFGCQTGGAATGHSYWVGFTFDNRTGAVITLKQFFRDGMKPALVDLFIKHLGPVSEDLFPDWVKSIASAEFGFYLEGKGVVFFFPKYSIGPGVMGVVSIEIPFKELDTLIVPEWRHLARIPD